MSFFKRLFSSFGFFLFAHLVFGQNPGALPNDSMYEKLEILPIRLKDFKAIPSQYDTLLNYCHQPTDQGRLPSCVAHAIANTISISYAVECDYIKPEKPLFSASFIYNSLSIDHMDEKHQSHEESDDCVWLEIVSGLEFSDTLGACPLELFENSRSTCKDVPSQSVIEEARKYSIKNYWKVIELCDTKKIDIIRQIISEYNTPVLVGINLTPSYEDLKNTSHQTVWNPSPDEPTPDSLLHAMVVVAYDKDWFKLMDSRGSGGSSKGYVLIKNEAFDRLVRYGFIVELYQAPLLECIKK